MREQVFAYLFGASAALDAFIVAFRVPNLLRDLFAEGALSQSFVAVFSKKLAKGEISSAQKLSHKVNGFILVAVGLLTILGIIFAAPLTHLFAAGFGGDKFSLTVLLMRVLFPFILFASLAAITMGILNAHNKYFMPHSASTFFNVTSIVCGVLFAYFWSPDFMLSAFKGNAANADFASVANAITGMAIGTLTGGLCQYAFQLPSVIKLGYRPALSFDFHDPELKQILALTLPAIIGGAAVQVNVLVNTQFASYLGDGSVSYLNYAFRFMQFPLGVFGVAIASATAPQLAKKIALGKTEDFVTTLRGSIQMSLFLSIPATVGLIVLGQEIIALIYQHGQFTTTDTAQTAFALSAYAFGICGYSLIKIYQPAFLAHNDAKTPMFVSFASIAINFAINAYFVLYLQMGFWSLALGTAIVASFNFVFLALLFRKKHRAIWHRDLWFSLLKIIISALVMGCVVWHCEKFVFYNISNDSYHVLRVLIPMTAGAVVYFVITGLLRVEESLLLFKKIFSFREMRQ